MTEDKNDEEPDYFECRLTDEEEEELVSRITKDKPDVWKAGAFDAGVVSEAGGGSPLLDYQDFSVITLKNGDIIRAESDTPTTADAAAKQLEEVLGSIIDLQKTNARISKAQEESYAKTKAELNKITEGMIETYNDWKRNKTFGYRAKSWIRSKLSRKKEKDAWVIGDVPFTGKIYESARVKKAAMDIERAKRDDSLSGAASVIQRELEKRKAKEEAHDGFKEWCESTMKILYNIEKQDELLRDIEEQIGLIDPPEELRDFMSQIKLMLSKAKERVSTC